MTTDETHWRDAAALGTRLFDELRRMSANPPGVTRPAFSDREDAAHAIAARAAESIGMEISHDRAGNQYMTWPGRDRAAPRVMVGSHMDSVDHGGNFDGAAGVVLGLAAATALHASGFVPARDLVVMAIRAEELVWFPTPYCGSRMAFGVLPAAEYEAVKRSDTGRSLADHMREGGWDPDALIAGARELDPATLAAYIEPHIEQGPVLDLAGEAVGVVTGIRGNLRYRHASITGAWAHAGGVPREHRHDAVRAGAALVGELEAIWDRYDAAGEDFVATFGEFWTDPTMHGMTKVPGLVRFTLDMRSLDNELLWRTDGLLREAAASIGRRYEVTIELGEATNAKPALMNPELMDLLDAEAARAGIAYRRMASGGGHDCATFADQGVPSAMLFLRNQNGSHNPDEAIRMEDFAAAVPVLAGTLRRLLSA
ncbi:hydantoinase/carbamoylase family amidase [Acuticoccus sp. I52.16.1]|uniref:hydantoinase/carbamoylase family amidase n=1 Tax=Acuticoccus sp. I52.16.1 TaxID=2928472 RepID=UPI001FD482B0|nr:hydantoinase/carbamoylase family amidase [Acuticoccus sp. I52.16.1]UOM36046.1 hydantoinase/carbamoylase family amidase [Acuticoccus sp. I52.16.1]